MYSKVNIMQQSYIYFNLTSKLPIFSTYEQSENWKVLIKVSIGYEQIILYPSVQWQSNFGLALKPVWAGSEKFHLIGL